MVLHHDSSPSVQSGPCQNELHVVLQTIRFQANDLITMLRAEPQSSREVPCYGVN